MTRLIDADAIPWDVEGVGEIPVITKEEIDQMPTVDAVPVRHGKWIRDEFGARCGVCGLYAYRDKFDQPWESPYCPICGARMDERKEIGRRNGGQNKTDG
jgi:hypothetical protein